MKTESLALGSLLHELAMRSPDGIAVITAEQRLTFRQMNERVDEAAKALIAHQVTKGETISILDGNTVDWLVIAAAAARIGAVVAPINTWYREREVVWQLNHADSVLLFATDGIRGNDYADTITSLVTNRSLCPKLRSIVSLRHSQLDGTVPFSTFISKARNVSDADLSGAAERVEPHDLLFLLYTSGSTMHPRGVRLHNESVLQSGRMMAARFGIVEDDRIWLGTPLFFGFGASNAWPVAWTQAASLVIQSTFVAEAALELIQSSEASVFYGFGNIAHALKSLPGWDPTKVARLRKGPVGFNRGDKKYLLEDFGLTDGSSMYGMTELYGLAVITEFTDDIAVKLETQGRPLPGVELRIVDPDTEEELPSGQVGEIRVRGRVTSGYHKEAELTRNSFDAEGYIRTGDLASIDANGRLRFVARLKEMIKVGGINVSPAEVEDLLLTHPSIREAHVVGIPDGLRDEVIAAFVHSTTDISETDVTSFLRERSASFKTPHYVIFATPEEMPRGATGKIMKRALRERAIELIRNETAASQNAESDGLR